MVRLKMYIDVLIYFVPVIYPILQTHGTPQFQGC